MQRPVEHFLGRRLADALPDAGGLLAILAHAGAADAPVTWRGQLAPDGAQLSVTAVAAADLLHLTFRPVADDAEDPSAGDAPAEGGDADTGRARLASLAQAPETRSGPLAAAEAATQRAELAVPRLGDWAIPVVRGEDGRPEEEGRAHRAPARRTDVDSYRDGR